MKIEGNFTIPDEQIELGHDLLGAIEMLSKRLVEPFEWIDEKAAAKRLGKSLTTIRAWRKAGWLRYYDGGGISYRTDYLDADFEAKFLVKAFLNPLTGQTHERVDRKSPARRLPA